MFFFIYLFIFEYQFKFEKANLNFELNSPRLALIHTNQSRDIESLDSTQNNSNFCFPKFENINSL
jgi:hypothetical protein